MATPVMTPNDAPETLSDRELLVRIAHQLDHLDEALHEVQRIIAQVEPLTPLVPRMLALADPLAAARATMGRRARGRGRPAARAAARDCTECED